eukprot:scaffold72712_cov15-Tisochrysis_lutea.AAC.1
MDTLGAWRVETILLLEHNPKGDRSDRGGLQDEKLAVFLCSCVPICSLKMTFAHLFSEIPSTQRIFSDESGAHPNRSSIQATWLKVNPIATFKKEKKGVEAEARAQTLMYSPE